MGPQAGDPRAEKNNQTPVFSGEGSALSWCYQLSEAPFFYSSEGAELRLAQLCLPVAFFSSFFYLPAKRSTSAQTAGRKRRSPRGCAASPGRGHTSRFKPRNLGSAAWGNEEKRRGICSGLEHFAGVTLSNALSEISFLLSNCMFSSAAANPKSLPTPPFPLSTNDKKPLIVRPAPHVVRASETVQTRLGNILPLRFWEQAAIIVFMVVSSAPEPGSAG